MQENILLIPRTDTTPRVELNPVTNIYVIDGWSWPFDAISFYEPIFKWIKEHGSQYMNGSTFQIRLAYFNTPTAKMLMELLELLASLRSKNIDIKVKWAYVSEDDKEEISDSFAPFVNIPFEFEQINADDVLLRKNMRAATKNQYKPPYDKLFIEKCTLILKYVIWNSLYGEKEKTSGIDDVYKALNGEIPKDEIEYILELFEQAEGTFLSKSFLKEKGNGYALNISKQSMGF